MKKFVYKRPPSNEAHKAGKASAEEEGSVVEILYPDLEALDDLSRTVAWFVFEERLRLNAKKPKDKNYLPPDEIPPYIE